MSFLTKMFHYVLLASYKYNIDESHGVSHSMNVLNYANNIYEDELIKNPILSEHKNIIYVSAVLHDMCDKKYVDPEIGLLDIDIFLDKKISPEEIDVTKKIMSTMSYSYVKKNGYPDLGRYQLAYNIVREADLLSAYDFDRCMIYNMHKFDGSIFNAFNDANQLFEKRVLQHNNDKLFTTEYSKKMSIELHNNSLKRIQSWKNIIKNSILPS